MCRRRVGVGVLPGSVLYLQNRLFIIIFLMHQLVSLHILYAHMSRKWEYQCLTKRLFISVHVCFTFSPDILQCMPICTACNAVKIMVLLLCNVQVDKVLALLTKCWPKYSLWWLTLLIFKGLKFYTYGGKVRKSAIKTSECNPIWCHGNHLGLVTCSFSGDIEVLIQLWSFQDGQPPNMWM